MKKFILGLLLLSTFTTFAQTNLQVNYDFGEGRKYITSTLEMFKTDKWGNTFFFVDMDFNGTHAPGGSYMEIARCINTWGGPLSAHVEYNGGLGSLFGGYGINNAWLGGLDYFMHSKDFSKTLNLKLLYKQIMGKQASAQFTTVWGLNFFKNKLTFSGFADFWLEDNVNTDLSKTSTVFISEPQLWYNVNEHLSAGGEVEISSNFAGTHGLMINPTLGLKWNF